MNETPLCKKHYRMTDKLTFLSKLFCYNSISKYRQFNICFLSKSKKLKYIYTKFQIKKSIRIYMRKVRPISFDQIQCGKKIADTKKRFKWVFDIQENNYVFEVVNSVISGKRTVFLNSKQIYSQKDVFNLKFDFNVQIDGHSIRVIKKGQKLNQMQLIIDGRDFHDLLQKNKSSQTNQNQFNTKSGTNAFSYNPFSDFLSIAQAKKVNKEPGNGNNPESSNNFGVFDFDEFQMIKKGSQKQSSNQKKPSKFELPQQKTLDNDICMDLFRTNGINAFEMNFKNAQKQLDIDQSAFATNNFQNCNNFMQLYKKKHNQDTSEQWSNVPKHTFEKGSVADRLNLNNLKVDISGKKILNDARVSSKLFEEKINAIHEKFAKKF